MIVGVVLNPMKLCASMGNTGTFGRVAGRLKVLVVVVVVWLKLPL
jgi:hypothetical protein